MTNEEAKGIQDIKGTLGFRVIESILNERIKELDSVTNIDELQPNLKARTIGRKLAVKWCESIKNEINLSVVPEKDKRRTYE